MTRYNKYAIVFILAFLAANILWGIRHQQTMREVEAHIEALEINRDCWQTRYHTLRFNWPDDTGGCG